MRSFAILAAVVASASAFGVMETSDNQCIVAGKVSNKETALTLGECDADNVVEFKFTKQDSSVKTADGKCLAVSKNSEEEGANVVLASCKPNKEAGKKWSLLDGNVWSNGNDWCLTFDEEADSLIQADCVNATEIVMDGCKVEPIVETTSTASAAPTATATIVPAPPAPYTCGNYVGSVGPNACAAGYFVPSNYYNYICTSPTCAQTCCVAKPPQPRTCSQWAASSGVYPSGNVCGQYGQLIAYPGAQTCTNDKDCFYRCCEKPAPVEQSCKTWSSSAYKGCLIGTTLIPNAAATMCPTDPTSKACNEICCEAVVPPTEQTCAQWDKTNNCAPGSQTIADVLTTKCAFDGSNCQETCCEQFLPPSGETQTCGAWSDAGNTCAAGTTQWPNVYIACDANGSDCQAKCCRKY